MLRVQERRLIRRQEELRRQTLENRQRFAKQGLLDKQIPDKAAEVLRLWAKIAETAQRLTTLDADRQKAYKAQQQIQSNMGALATTGKEGVLRTQYVDQLQASEEQLRVLSQQQVEARLRAL